MTYRRQEAAELVAEELGAAELGAAELVAEELVAVVRGPWSVVRGEPGGGGAGGGGAGGGGAGGIKKERILVKVYALFLVS